MNVLWVLWNVIMFVGVVVMSVYVIDAVVLVFKELFGNERNDNLRKQGRCEEGN